MVRKYKNRDSNLELLRIFSMLFVLVLHFNGLALPFPTHEDLCQGISFSEISQMAIESFALVAVNCFILISGYFGIKFKLHNLVSLFIQCFFYSVIIYLIFCFMGWESFRLKDLFYSFLAFSNSPLWFIRAYVGLYLFAPLLNRAVDGLSHKEYIRVLTIFTIINIYFGWLWKWDINQFGYGISQMIYMYVIGRYLKHYGIERIKNVHIKSFWGYIFGSLLFLIWSILLLLYGGNYFDKYVYDYNHPIVVISSICLFLWFATMKIGKQWWINWIALSVLSVYIIHMNPYVWPELRGWILQSVENKGAFELFIWVSIVILAVFIACIAIDKLRMLLTNPVECKIERLLKKVGLE